MIVYSLVCGNPVGSLGLCLKIVSINDSAHAQWAWHHLRGCGLPIKVVRPKPDQPDRLLRPRTRLCTIHSLHFRVRLVSFILMPNGAYPLYVGVESGPA